MRWIRLLLVTLAAILLVLGAGVTFILTQDLNDYKETVERLVERSTGRTLVIDGRIDLELGPKTALTLTNARFSNPGWSTDEYMAHVGRAYIVLNLRSVLGDAFLIELIELEKSELNIELQASGRNNWTFGAEDDKPEKKERLSDDKKGFLPLILRQAHVDNFTLTVRTPALERPLEVLVDRLDQVELDDGLFDAKLRGLLNGRELNVSGEYGPLESLIAAKDLNLDITGQFGTLSIIAKGLIDDLTGPRRPRAEISITGPDIDDITGMLGLPDSGSGDIDLEISLRPRPKDQVGDRVDLLAAGSVGENRIDLSGHVSDFKHFDRISVRMSMAGPDLHQAARLLGRRNFPEGPFRLSGAVGRDGTRLDLDDIRLDIGSANLRLDGKLTKFPGLKDANLALDIHGQNLGHFTRLFGFPGKVEGPFHIVSQIKVDTDGVDVVNLDVDTDVAKFTASGTLGTEPGLVGTRASLSGRGVNITDLGGLLGITLTISEPFTFAGDLELVKNAVLLSPGTTFTIGNHRLVAAGRIGFDSMNDADLHLQISGDSLVQLTTAFGVGQFLPPRDYQAATRLRMQPAGYRISDFNGRFGADVMTVDGLISRKEKFSGTHLKIAAKGTDLGKLFLSEENLRLIEGPFDISGEVALLTDEVRLKKVNIKLDDASAQINADIGLPLASANGSYDIAAKGASFRKVLPDTGAWEPPDSPFELRVRGKLDNGLLQVKPLTIQLGEARLTAEGVFDIPPDLNRTSLDITARAASLAAIGTLNERVLPDVNFSLDASFAGTPQSFSVEKFEILTGASNLTGSVVVHLDREIPDARLRLHSDLIDMTPLLAVAMEPAKATAGSADNDGDGPTGDGRLIPDLPLPLAQLKKFNAVVDVDIASYRQNNRIIDNIVFDATVLDGVLDVERVSGKTTFGSMTANLRIEPTKDSARMKSVFSGENMMLGSTLDKSPIEIEVAPKFKLAVDIDGTGLTTREIAASLNGGFRISAGEGRAANSNLRFLYGSFIEELFTSINPFAKTEPYTEISCVMINARIDNGKFNADPGIALQTDKMNIISTGSIDLRNEKIDFEFKTGPRKKISISAGEFINPYLKVTGTMARPRLTLDKTGTLVTGGAAVATAGLSILATAIWDRVSAASDPCNEIVKAAEKKEEKKEEKMKKQ